MNSSIDTQKNELRILTQSDWDSMYSKQDYTNKTEHAKTYVLHHLLAFNQSDKSILPFIEKINNPSTLTLADSKNANLTPLLIATMRGRFKVVQVLFETYKTIGKSISDEKDQFGWTVMHHAKISSKEIFEFLSSQGINTQVKNLLCGTPDDLGKLVGREITPITAEKTFLQMVSGQLIRISEIGQEKMKELMGINEYRDQPFYPENELKKFWQLPGKGPTQFTRLFGDYSKNPPLLTIRPCMELTGHSASLELCARQDLPFGSIACEYTGIVKTTLPYAKTFIESVNAKKEVEYLLANVDAKDVGNAARYVNWGWPNVIASQGVDKGTPRNILFVISEGIKMGEPIQFDYGIEYSSLAFGAQKLLGRSQMRAFFAQGNLKDHVARLDQANAHAKNSIDFYKFLKIDGLNCYLRYPLNTPSALLDLHFSGIIHAKEWLEQWLGKRADFILNWAEKNPGHFMSVQSLLLRMTEIDIVLSNRNQLKKFFGEWVINSIGNFSVMQILKAMDYIVYRARTINDSSFSDESWNKLQNDLEKRLVQYDWTQDEEAPLGLKRRREDLVNIHQGLLESGRKSKLDLVRDLLPGLKYWANDPEKQLKEGYQNLIYLAEGLGIKDSLLEMYEKDPH